MNISLKAKKWLDQGYSVFPCVDKKPCVKWEKYQTKYATNEELIFWEGEFPNADLAVVCGDISNNLIVIDFDKATPKDLGLPDNGYIVKTPRGGSHYYYATTENIKTGVNKPIPGVDIRAVGGYVVMYNENPPKVLHQLPRHLENDLLAYENRKTETKLEPIQTTEGIPEGSRNATLFKYACSLRGRGLEPQEIIQYILAMNATYCNPPLKESEVKTIVESASGYEPNEQPFQNETFVSASDHLNNEYMKDMDLIMQYKDLKTGFKNLDNALKYGFQPGLYTIGAPSGGGKTTFAHQMADHFASENIPVLFFSLEQNRTELVSKSLSRLGFKTEGLPNLPAMQYRLNKDLVTPHYIKVGKNLYIEEGNFELTADKIRERALQFRDQFKEKFVIFVDYLQIIPGDSKLSDKQRVDQTIIKLKQLSRELKIPIVAISSINRSSYDTPLSFESLKESGSVEFSSDVVFVIQLQAVHKLSEQKIDGSKSRAKTPEEKQQEIDKAMKAKPRQMELKCLKLRHGESRWTIYFDYFSEFETFEEGAKCR